MAYLDLQLLLFLGTIIYLRAISLKNAISTIDLIFGSACLVENQILYTTLDIDHGLDYTAIRTVLSLNISKPFFILLYWLFKSTFSNKIL